MIRVGGREGLVQLGGAWWALTSLSEISLHFSPILQSTVMRMCSDGLHPELHALPKVEL